MSSIAKEEYSLLTDSKYRMYTSAVDKALKNFEYTAEWADLISALGKLNKVLTNYQKFPITPRRIKICKRLAQCMHPALPSGVHLKALETYDIMFKSMGTNRLSEELFIYGAGLFPLLGHSAMFIRPTLLLLYETHFVPLGVRLRPALSGFLSGLLPGLEPGSDHFDRTNSILENVCEGVGADWFYTCIWQGIRSNSPVRLPAISYILAHYNRKISMEDQLYLMGRDIDVMISGLCAAVQDSSVLVQRSALDLLMVCFPTWNTQLLYADMVRLVTAALTTILRRDMSLNRRLYSWLLTSETKLERDSHSNEFQLEDDESDAEEPTTPTIAIDLLMEAIRIILKQGTAEIPLDVKPYRLLTSLFDKPQIGPLILDSILYDVFRALYASCLNLQKHKSGATRCVSFNGDITSLKGDADALKKDFLTKNCQELIRNANLLFNTLQTYYIWSYIERLFEKAVNHRRHRPYHVVYDIGSGEPTLLEICVLTDFLLDIIPIETHTSNTVEILPNLFSKIINVIRQNLSTLTQEEILESLRLSSKILAKIQPVAVMPKVTKIETLLEKEEEKLDGPKAGLEKSKSDSKINEKAMNELCIDDTSRERSNSNQMKKNKTKDSPKIDKKTKSKKSKSSSKLYDLKKEEDSDTPATVPTSAESEKEDVIVKEKPKQEEPIKIENKHIIMCLKVYKNFFERLLQTFIMQELDASVFFETLIKDAPDDTGEMVELLQSRLYNRPRTLYLHTLSTTTNSDESSQSLDIYDETILVASNLLIEFAAFPNILNDDQDKEFPHWLKLLIGCACSHKGDNTVKVTCMNTLLKVVSLAKSQSIEKHSNNNNVVLMGILDSHYVTFIEERTVVMEAMCKILWDLLGYLNNQQQLMLCVTLLYSIHNVFDTKLFVENVIGKYLIDENLCTEFFKRFFLLWHLGRDLNLKNPSSSNLGMRNFERCLLKIMDNLNNSEKSNIRLLSETFITHSLLRHDISRIINPLFIRLLNPTTARISIKFVNIEDHHESQQGGDDGVKSEDLNAKKIYAISSVNGNVMFHVTEGPSPKPSKKKWFIFPRSGKKSQIVNMTANLTDNLNIVTKRNKDYKPDVSPNIDRAKGVKLFINPLSSKEIYPNGVDGSYTKLEHSSTESLYDNKSQADSGFVSMNSHLTNEKRRSDIFNDTKAPEVAIGEESFRMTRSKSLDEKTLPDMESIDNMHSWSDCESADVNSVDVKTADAAEEYFKTPPMNEDIAQLLNDILEQVCPSNEAKSKNFTLYPIHQHLCLYYELFDTNQIIYTLRTLKNCINSNPLLFIRCLATSGLKDLNSNNILYLLARHRKSMQGAGFTGDITPEHVNAYRGFTFLDVLITITLNYIKSFYPALDDVKLTKTELDHNLQIQLNCLEILDIVIKHLINIVNDNSKGFSGYIADTLKKCTLQKVLLHCLLMSVRNVEEDASFAEEVLLYNNFRLYDNQKRVTEYMEAYQILLLRLINSLIILEFKVFPEVSDVDVTPTILIPQQSMFLSAILSALKHQNMKHLHQNWCHMVTSCLPYFNDNLKQISVTVVQQICNNVEKIADSYKSTELGGELCADYATTQLESLTILVHYNLLDSTQTANQNLPAAANVPNSVMINTTEIFNNLVNAFFSPIGGEINLTNKQNHDNYQLARKAILSHMPRIITSVAKLWQTVVSIEGEFEGVFGHSKTVKQQLLEFLSPIAVHHSASFLAAVAVAWHERRNPFMSVKTALPEPNASQSNLVYLISAIRVIPLDNLVQTVTNVIKNPPPTEGLSSEFSLDVSILELFYCYMRNATPTQISEAWTSLLTLIREGCSLSPPCQFLLGALLHELMIKCCPLEERKDQKDLQDATGKLIECVSQVCGACLEQTTWLRRNLSVRELEQDSTSNGSVTPGSTVDIVAGGNNSSHSVQAQLVLSEILAPILDICFGSVEKDKVNNILQSLMYNIVPYLRTHTSRNMPSFNACSKLMASLSSYQYTRKAWKKDVFDLLLDNTLFQMDQSCLKYWKVIVDNLMTHDNTTFRDLMSRVSMTQSGSLNIFASRELEYEQRAHLLKRLAFVIFCSETDQYAKYMPDIQEQLTASLRLSVPNIQAQVFMCFRVLLIRMSPLHVTSLWPIIISEMLTVFIQIENELQTDSEDFSAHIKYMSSLDPSWTQNSNNGLHALGNPHWLRLWLAAAKLLDLVLLLPATSLPQFQMYRWAFVGDNLIDVKGEHGYPEGLSFTPHVCRIAEFMDKKYADSEIETLPTKQNELLLTVSSINQLQDLHPFFKTLSLCSNRHRTECSGSVSNDLLNDKPVDKKMQCVLEKLDKIIEIDFLDKISR